MRNPFPLLAVGLAVAAFPLLGAGSASATGAPAPAPAAAQLTNALSLVEVGWLSPLEFKDYTARLAAAAAADKPAIVKQFRDDGVAKNVPTGAAPHYQKLVAKGDGKKVDAYLDSLIMLDPTTEYPHLVAIVKGKGAGIGLQRDNAKLEYDAEMKFIQKDADGRPVLADRAHAHSIVKKYRALLHPKATTPPHEQKPVPPNPAQPAAAMDLTNWEQAWLTAGEKTAYAAALGAHPSGDALLALEKQYRDDLSKTDLPADARVGYTAALAAQSPQAIDAYLLTLAELNPSEHAALAKILRGHEPKNPDPANPSLFKLPPADDNAQMAYDSDMGFVLKGAQHPAPNQAHHAYKIVSKYRAMLAAAGITPAAGPTGPSGPSGPSSSSGPSGPSGPSSPAAGTKPVKLADADLALLTKDDRTAYNASWQGYNDTNDADGSQRAALNAKYQAIVNDLKGFDPKSVTSVDILNNLIATNKNRAIKFCKEGLPQGGNGAAAPTVTPKAKDQLIQADNGHANGQFSGDINSDRTTAGPSSPAAGGSTQDQLKLACQNFLNTDPGRAAVTGPGDQKGTDVETPPSTDAPENKHFWRDLGNGLQAGILGLIIGSFFGGPLVMIAVAVAAGAGAYALSSHLNTPKPPKTPPAGGS